MCVCVYIYIYILAEVSGIYMIFKEDFIRVLIYEKL